MSCTPSGRVGFCQIFVPDRGWGWENEGCDECPESMLRYSRCILPPSSPLKTPGRMDRDVGRSRAPPYSLFPFPFIPYPCSDPPPAPSPGIRENAGGNGGTCSRINPTYTGTEPAGRPENAKSTRNCLEFQHSAY